MTIKILAFGKIAELLSGAEQEMSGVETVGAVRKKLEADFPALSGLRYLIAVDKKIAGDEALLQEHSVVALLPPFSGG